ncbi:hypothetical protein L1887_46826 [Cichorium endivia]|nr:hypothetical protein L1887_46826 [Cichorium endivia]
MSFYSAFPTSPLSRSALEADSSSERTSASKSIGPRKSPAQPTSAVPIHPSRPDLPSMRKFASRVPLADTMPASLGLGHPVVSPNSSSRHVSGPARLMRSPNASVWSPSLAAPFDELAVSPPFASSSFSRSINTRRRSSGHSFSAASGLTPNFGSLVGSFQESLLSGRMSMPASKPLVFDAEVGVLGAGKCRPSLRCPPHLHIKFAAHFYDFHAIDARASTATPGSTAALGSPYVGTIDLESHYTSLLLSRRFSSPSTHAEPGEVPSFPGYAVPPKGQIQLIVKYPDMAAVKLFLVPYDLADMQPGTKTFVRQKTVVRPAPLSAADSALDDARLGTSEGSQSQSRTSPKEALRFAIHLQFCCPPTKSRRQDSLAGFEGSDTRRFRSRADAAARQPRAPRIFLHKSIRLVFGARALDAGEKLVDCIETPGTGSLRFSAYQGPDEEWLQLQEEMRALHSTVAPVPEASTGTETAGMGLGIAIQAPSAGHARDEGDELSNLVPLNSDPNGERWQASVSSSTGAAAPQDVAGAMPASLRSTWSASSQESSLGRVAPSWPAPQHEQHGVGQLAHTLASSHLSDSWADQRPRWTSRSRPAADVDAAVSASSTVASRRPSRMRSASAAGLSEPRVHSVSALGELQEVAAPPSQCCVAPDPAHSMPMPAWKASGIASRSGDRPSLLRKLSEQFARSHSPSPANSPRLTPTRRHENEHDELHIDEVTPTNDSHSRSIR